MYITVWKNIWSYLKQVTHDQYIVLKNYIYILSSSVSYKNISFNKTETYISVAFLF